MDILDYNLECVNKNMHDWSRDKRQTQIEFAIADYLDRHFKDMTERGLTLQLSLVPNYWNERRKDGKD